MSLARSTTSWKSDDTATKDLQEEKLPSKSLQEEDLAPLSPKDNQENSFDTTPKKNSCKQRKKLLASNPSPLSERQQIALLLQLTAVPDLQAIETRSSSKEKLNERGETALHIAAIRGDITRTKQLLEQGVQVDSPDFAGWTPLHEACNHGWLPVVELLIQAGANVNAKGLEETSPLHDAAANGHLKIVKLLLEHGADPRQTNLHHQTPLQLTHSKSVASLLQEVLANSESPTNHRQDKGEDSTMKKNAPSTPKSKGGDKGAQSSRLTIKLSQVKPSDSTSQGYTVSVDSGGSNDVYEFSKEEEPEPANPSDGSNGESEEPRAKRRKSTEKAPPILTPVTATSKSPASKQQRGSETDGEDPPHSPKVPPLKIVLPSSVEVETKERTLPYIVHSSEATTSPPEKEEVEPPPTPAKSKEGSPEERFQRMTRSAHRAAAAQASSSSSSSSENSAPSNSNNNVSTTDGVMGDEPAPELHPRKRKLRPRGEAASTSAAASSTTPPEPPPLPPPLPPLSDEPQQIFNPYQMYQNIRKQVAKKRESMYVVTPKPPQGFKDYLLNRCTYLLADTKTDGPEAKPPADLPEVMQEFYMEQEMERFKLRRQHLVEREKLTLAREQEILRVHARAARAAVNQSVPLSVCSVIKDMEIYNVLEPPKSEPSVAPEASRSRYNGRLFLSWLQDVTDKWDKIKEAMQLRQQNEAESLQAVQKLDWEWKLKEHGLCEPKTNPVIEDFHVPMVIVSTDFELLPP